MKISAIVENTSTLGWCVEHGLSLWIERKDGRHILFDIGQSDLFVENARRMGYTIDQVDALIVSHGHYDHGGGLHTFLSLNSHAPVYLHHRAFEPHYSQKESHLRHIGLDSTLSTHAQCVHCDGLLHIDAQMTLFSGVTSQECMPPGNARLYGPSQGVLDNFAHEQHLWIQEGELRVLIAGCAHQGIVNILRRAEMLFGAQPTHVFAGMHLMKHGLSAQEETLFIQSLAHSLMAYQYTQFYTMHCTGEEAFRQLQQIMGTQIRYLSCGERVVV